MRLVTYENGRGPRIAAVRDDGYVDLNDADGEIPSCPKAFLGRGRKAIDAAEAAAAKGAAVDPSSVSLRAPVPEPQKVICVGLNYADHARESGAEPPPEPVLFCKFASAVAAHEDEIVLPRLSQQVDYEAELVVVIGEGGKNIAREEALSRVGGYAVGHDVSARDWQLGKPGGQWLMGKTFDGFAPFGPQLVTADEVEDPGNLGIELRLNGETMQKSRTDQFIFKVDELIAYISAVCTLCPGDIIFTGTPGGVGMARKPQVFLKPGDVAEVEIERLGVLRNAFISGA